VSAVDRKAPRGERGPTAPRPTVETADSPRISTGRRPLSRGLEFLADGLTPTTLTTTPPTPQDGPATVAYSTSTAGLSPGSHQICVKAFGTDVTGGAANVQTCVTVKVYDLVLTPATATNELRSDHTHTVTATLLGPAGSMSGLRSSSCSLRAGRRARSRAPD
jgi:hypothetical protein